ncbi:isochorismate synthase [Flavobacterium sp.]
MTDLFLKIKTHQEQNLPFVIFSKPNSERTVGLFQKNDHLYFLENFEKKGFVFAAFDSSTIPFIPVEFCDVLVESNNGEIFYFETKEMEPSTKIGNDFFEELVAKSVEAIENGLFKKVVTSRRELVELKNFELEVCFKKMLQNYPSAFKYCFYHPKIGLWIGATPEQLVTIKELDFETVALAGTQKANNIELVHWTSKEEVEQQLVTDFILENIGEFSKELMVSSPFTANAGSIFHIKTTISGKLKNKKAVEKIIKALHPTSAVCGMPRDVAKDFIIQHEGYDREYYSGFLGELNIDLATFRTQYSDLFVNLRCMKINEHRAEIFVGCGITKDSNPKSEFEETVNKAMTMKNCIL